MLAKIGLEVSSVENGDKGIDLFLNYKFKLVMTDFNMPGMNDKDLANQIKKILPPHRLNLKFIYFIYWNMHFFIYHQAIKIALLKKALPI